MANQNTSKKILNIGALALTTALSTFSFKADAQPWNNFTDEHGSISIDTSLPSHTQITQTGNLYIGRSSNLDIAAGESVDIGQDTTASMFVAKADNGANPTRILGALSTSLNGGSGVGGSVMILDANGVFFGASSVINTGGIIASTGELNNDRLINDGMVELDNFGAGSDVTIEAGSMISVAHGGLAAFVAPTVVNNGIIRANMGRVELAGSNTKTTIDLYGDGLLEIAVDDNNTASLLAENNGEIYADSGVIHMTTGAAENIVDSIVNLKGITRADSATQIGGKIILGGTKTGKVKVTSKAQARGETGGGEITITAQDIEVTKNARVNVRARDNGDGGTINLLASNNAILNGRFRAMGGDNGGNGGTIKTSAVNDLTFKNKLEADASAANGEAGDWVIDPVNFAINALEASIFNTTLDNGTSVDLSATNDISVSSNLAWSGDASLSIDAGQDLTVAADVGGLDVDGDITLKAGRHVIADKSSNRVHVRTDAGAINVTAGEDIKFDGDGAFTLLVQANGGNITLDAVDDVRIKGKTALSSVSSVNGDVTVKAGDQVEVTGGDSAGALGGLIAINGALSIQASDLLIADGSGADVSVKGGESITITRSTDGSIGLGDLASGTMHLSQAELDTLETDTLRIGDVDSASNKTTSINVNSVNVAMIDNVTLTSNDLVDIDGNVTAAALTINGVRAQLNADLDATSLDGSVGTVNVESAAAEIQDGLDIAKDGGQVNVADDTYNQSLDVTKNVTLNGNVGDPNLPGAGSPILMGTGSGNGINVSAGLTNVTIQGFEIDNYDVAINADNAATDATVAGSTLDINNNTIRNVTDAAFIEEWETVNFNLNDASVSDDGVEIDNFKTATFSGNVLTGDGSKRANENGILIWDNGSLNNATINVTGNTITNFGEAVDVQNEVTVNVRNNFLNNNVDAVNVDTSNGSLVTVSGNDLSGNTRGIQNRSGEVVNASGNWWGTADESAIEAYMDNIGAGSDVDFSPFLVSPTDTDASTLGFQGDLDEVSVSALGGQVGSVGRIQEGHDLVNVNGIVNVGAGTFFDNVNISKALRIRGVNRNSTILDASGGLDGFNISSDLGNGNVILQRMTIQNAGRDGVHVSESANLRRFIVGGLDLNNNNNRGVAVFGDSVQQDSRIVNSNFLNNGLGSTSDGDGDILFFKHNKNIEITNVDIQGNTAGSADYGIQIRGSDTLAQSGNITLTDVSVAGDYRAALVGLQEFDGVASLSMTNVELGGQTAAGTNSKAGLGFGSLYFSNLGQSDLNIGNTAFDNVDGLYIANGTPGDVNATSATFLGRLGSELTLDENFAVEDKVGHAIDLAGLGLVTWNSGNLYVTQLSETVSAQAIQRGIDNAENGFNIWVDSGNFAGNLNVNKSLNLYGAQAGVDARNRTGVEETVIIPNSPGFDVTASNVLIDGFDINGGNPGIKVANVDDVVIRNNIVRNQSAPGNSDDGISVDDATNVLIEKNWLHDNGDEGIYARDTLTGLVIQDNLIEDTRNNGIEIINGKTPVTIQRNTINRAGLSSIRMDKAGGSLIRQNTINANAATDHGIFVRNSGGTNYTNDTDIIDNIVNGTGNGVGVYVQNSDYLSIHGDNDISGFTTAVRVSGSDNAYIGDNDIDNATTAVLVDNISNNAVIFRNDIDDVSTGISVLGGNNHDIDFNTIDDVVTGIHLNGGQGTDIMRNNIDGSDRGALISGTGILVENANNVEIGSNGQSNRIDDLSNAIKVSGGDNVEIDANIITDATIGIDAVGVSRLNIEDNILDARFAKSGKGEVGIRVANSTNARIGGLRDGNTVEDFATGIQVNSSFSADIEHNDVDEFTVNGIHAQNSTFVDVINNTVHDGSGNAVYVANSDRAEIEGNIIDDISNGHGILVNPSDNVEVIGNRLHDIAWDGIHVDGGRSALISNNHVHGTGFDGIDVRQNSNVRVDNNEVYDAGDNGIEVSDSFNADITRNDVRRSGDDGIDVERSLIADIRNNIITDAGDDGIDVEDTRTFFGFGVDIADNTINGAAEDAINVDNVSAVDIIDNTISDAGRDGIHVNGSIFADITGNNIQGQRGGFFRNGAQGAGRDGIHVTNSAFVDVEDNDVQAGAPGFFSLGGIGSGRFGIYVDNSFAADVNNNRVVGNVLRNSSGNDAIRLEDSAFADVDNNVISQSRGDAIHVIDSFGVDVTGNLAALSGDDGIDVEGSNEANVSGNNIIFTRNNAIELENGTSDAVVEKNIIAFAGGDGVSVNGGRRNDIIDNTINATNNGITVDDSVRVKILRNDVDDARQNGIVVNDSDRAKIRRNKVRDASQNSIVVDGGENVKVKKNKVRRSGEHGIIVRNTVDALVNDNLVRKSGEAGVLVDGAFATEVTDNRLQENAYGLEVRGNELELKSLRLSAGGSSDETIILNNAIEDNSVAGIRTVGNAVNLVEASGNQLNNNTIGMLLEGGEINISDLLNPNTIEGGETGMRFAGDDVSLVNDTIGATIFSNQSGNYIELVDGALFNPGTPTIIDALAANFDGIVPLESPLGAGILSATLREAIEDRIVDFDDDVTLGQILVGLDFSLAQEDLFALNLFSLSPDAANVNVTFRGQPPVIQPDLQALASLSPAAGGEGTESAEDLANLEPAAGGDEGCWASLGDTGFDGTVNFSFGGDISSAIDDAACAN